MRTHVVDQHRAAIRDGTYDARTRLMGDAVVDGLHADILRSATGEVLRPPWDRAECGCRSDGEFVYHEPGCKPQASGWHKRAGADRFTGFRRAYLLRPLRVRVGGGWYVRRVSERRGGSDLSAEAMKLVEMLGTAGCCAGLCYYVGEMTNNLCLGFIVAALVFNVSCNVILMYWMSR